MIFDDVIKILLFGGSITLGAFLAAVRSKLSSSNEKNKLHYVFYVIAGMVVVGAIIATLIYWTELNEPNWLGIIVIVLSVISSGALVWFTAKYIFGKDHYKTEELDPIVNSFTSNADKHNIKLLAGDLNFFGNTPQDMDKNSQYNCLPIEGFKSIQILCTEPATNVEKIRYGKILSDFPMIQLRYYTPPSADLLVRGRMKTLNNVTHLLIYNKVKSGVYKALETDTANSNGALYNHIWNLIWALAAMPSNNQLEEYQNLFRN
jgi:hypothetical protein